jgi:hypothetical protein
MVYDETNVSDVSAAYIFRVEEEPNEKLSVV